MAVEEIALGPSLTAHTERSLPLYPPISRVFGPLENRKMPRLKIFPNLQPLVDQLVA